jgi:hypothetical protein
MAPRRSRRLLLPSLPCQSWLGIFHDFEAKFLDHGIGKDVARDALDFGLGRSAVHILEIQHEEFALADVAHGGMSQRGKRLLNGGALGIKHRGFEHHPNVSFHW